MLTCGRLSKYQREEIEKIFWEKDYKKNIDVIRDLVKIGLNHTDEFDTVKIDSPIEKIGKHLYFNLDMEKRIKEIRKQWKIKEYIVVIRILIEIGLKHRDELPNRST